MAPPEPQTESRSRILPSGDLFLTALMAIAGLAAVGGFGVLFSLWLQSGEPGKFETLRLASEQFVAGNRTIASDLARGVELSAEDDDEAEWLPLRDFLVGAGLVTRALEQDDRGKRRELFYEAVPSLKEAHVRGFPAGRKVEGNRLLATCLFHLGRYRESIPHFAEAFSLDPSVKRRLTPMLAQAHLRALPGDPGQALDIIRTYLRDPTLTVNMRRGGELIQIEALSDLGRWDEAERLITQAQRSQDEPTASRFQRQVSLLLAETEIRRALAPGTSGRQQPFNTNPDRTRLSTALRRLGELERTSSPKVAARARLLTAKARLAQGDSEAALAELTRVRQQRPFAGEGIAAALSEIELLVSQNRGPEAVLTARYLVRELGNPKQFDGSIVSFPEFRRRLETAVGKLRQQDSFESAIDVARALTPLFGPAEAKLQEANAYREWAEARRAEHAAMPGGPDRSSARRVRDRFRAAGDAFAEAAKLSFTTDRYVPSLWNAIEAYQNGRHFQQSLNLLESYLKYEIRLRRPRGLIAKAEALLAIGGEQSCRDAISAMDECVHEYPRNPLAYDARLLAAQAHAQLGDIQAARELLETNLADVELAPSNPVWRDSLFTLGELLYRAMYTNHLQADHAIKSEKTRIMKANRDLIDAAVRRLGEAVQRYWRAPSVQDPPPRALYAAYLQARTHRIAAELPMLEATGPEINSFVRRNLRQLRDRELGAALTRFKELRSHLERQLDERGDDETNLPALQVALLRNCRVAEADTLLEMGRFEDAAAAYRSVTLRYMDRPLALEGILGQAKCLRRSGRPREAEVRLQQASQVLRRIPEEWNDRFVQVTRYDRASWEKLLAWMNNRRETAAPPPTNPAPLPTS